MVLKEQTVNWKSVITLSIAQSLFQTASILVMTLSGIVGLNLATDKSLATLPIAMISVGTASMMIPASLFMKRFGRKRGFTIGVSIGILSGLLTATAILYHSFPLFVVGNMLVGCYQGFAQYYRFAAADTVPESKKGKAISFVIAGGVVAAIAGPTLAKLTRDIGATPFVYSYLTISALSIVALLLISKLQINKPIVTGATSHQNSGRSLSTILKQPIFLAAIFSSVVGYAVMIMVMTATPLAMKGHGHTMDDSATVIQWHVLGMFVPSFFTGNLIERYGAHRIITLGILILFVHITFALTGTDFFHFISGLILLGVGWNFMFVGGSTLLTKSYQDSEKEKTQATHDFIVFGIISASSFAAGSILNHWGWTYVNLSAIPLLLIAFIIIRLFRYRERKAVITASKVTYHSQEPV